MSLAALDNPLERLAVLPNAMNWRGGWSATEQYYKNDVVVSPSNNASYILATKTTLLDGGDPTLNPDWIELSLPTTGVQSVTAGLNMALNPLGTATNPILDNDGVRTFTAGLGLQPDPLSTANDVIINNIGVLSVVQGLGMNITAGQNPTITNDGVRQILTAGGGISVDANVNTPTLTNTGIISLAAGPGIKLTGGNDPKTIESIAAQPFLTSVSVVGSSAVSGPVPLATTPPNDAVRFQTSAPALGGFIQILADATKGGGFLLDLTGFSFYADQQILGGPASVVVTLNGITPGPGPNPPWSYPIPSVDNGQINLTGANAAPPQNFLCNGGQVFLDLAAYRAVSGNPGAGFAGSAFTTIEFTNQTGLPLYYASFPRTIFMRYYPGGVV